MSKNQKASLIKVIFLSASGFFLFVCMDSTAKYLGNVMPVTQAVWGRFFFHFVALCVYFVTFKPKLNLTRNFKIQIIRSLLMVTATFFMFNSLQRFDLVDIYVVFFSAPSSTPPILETCIWLSLPGTLSWIGFRRSRVVAGGRWRVSASDSWSRLSVDMQA